MNYVYLLQNETHPEQFYTGLCANVQARLAAHNAGQSAHTSKYKPWRLLSCHWFASPPTAAAFERYLKTGSGRAFAAKHLRTQRGFALRRAPLDTFLLVQRVGTLAPAKGSACGGLGGGGGREGAGGGEGGT